MECAGEDLTRFSSSFELIIFSLLKTRLKSTITCYNWLHFSCSPFCWFVVFVFFIYRIKQVIQWYRRFWFLFPFKQFFVQLWESENNKNKMYCFFQSWIKSKIGINSSRFGGGLAVKWKVCCQNRFQRGVWVDEQWARVIEHIQLKVSLFLWQTNKSVLI